MGISSSFFINSLSTSGNLTCPEGKEGRKTEFDRDSSQVHNRFLSAMDQATLAHRILCANKAFSSARVKRAVSEGAAAESPRTTCSGSPQLSSSFTNQQELRMSLPEIKDDLMNTENLALSNMRSAKPSCSRLQNNRPNPPAPPGYLNWEKFLSSDPDPLSSDGDNMSVRNPSQELTQIDRETGIIRRKFEALRQENVNYVIYNKFQRDLGCSLIDRREAEAKFRDYKRDIHNAFLDAISTMYLKADKLKQLMSQELQKIRHGKPNRWIDGESWNSISNADQWQREWENRYLPKARRAVWDVAMPNYLDETQFTAQRNEWLNKGSVALQQLAARKGWLLSVIPNE